MSTSLIGNEMREAMRVAGLQGVVVYRRRNSAEPWVIMAAFDQPGVAERYHGKQNVNPEWPWEYGFIDLSEP